MTSLLLRLFLKKPDDLTSPQSRAAVGKLSGYVGIVCNLLLSMGKGIVGVLTGSVSIAADALNNLSDASGSIVTLIGFRLADKPADEDHPFGHARAEYLSGLAVAGLILIIGAELVKSSVDKILNPTPVEFSVVVAGVLLASIGVKLWMFLFNNSLGKRIDSTALRATAQDSRNDCITTTAVLAAALIEHFWNLPADGYIGLGVALFILYSGVQLAKDTISPLLGENANPELQQKIVDYIAEHVTDSVRDLEGVLVSLMAHSTLADKPLDLQLAEKVIARIVNITPKVNTVERIRDVVCDYFDLSVDAISTKSRKREVVQARQIAMYLIRSMTNLSLDEIGKVFDNRDHSTVLYSIQQIEKKMKKDPAFAETVKEIKTNINSKR